MNLSIKTPFLPKFLRPFSGALCLSLCLISISESRAQAGKPTDTDQEVFDDKRGDISIDQETLDKAETAFFGGLTAYRAKKYTEAAKLFETAHKLVPYRDLLFNIARAYEALNNRSAAIKYYREYLATKPIDETQVIHRMRELGVSQFEEVSPSTENAQSMPKVPSQNNAEIDYLSWGVIGSGVALLSVGAYFGISALDQAERARDATLKSRYNDAKSQAETEALLADVGITIGVAAITGGLYLLLTEDQKGPVKSASVSQSAKAPQSPVFWQVLYSSELQGLGLSGSF